MNGNLPNDMYVERLDNEVVSEKTTVEIIENSRPLTPVNANSEVFEEITQQLNQLHSTPKPFRDMNTSTPPPSPAEFGFEKEQPPNFLSDKQPKPNEDAINDNVASNNYTEGI